ncbi:MAG: helix-hairpin-helix domain-containing protein [Candidatus Thermoplasmatota archaeon]|nr:helix-hairpin-helix domain-containing protein [Candidatus Thermoplasmatota archaeon]
MPNQKNSKGKIIEKLHMILDDPYNTNAKIDEKTLMALRARLIDDRTTNKHRTVVEKDSLKATISIHEKPDLINLQSLPEFKEVESPDHQNLQKCDPFQEEDIYEVEKITTFIPLPDESLPIRAPSNSISIDTKTVVFEAVEENLPEWEPVEEDKQTESFDSAPSKPVEEFKPVEKETLKEDKEFEIEVFKEIPSIDDKTAVLLYNNNYRSLDDLKKTSAKELSKTTGMKKSTARKIIRDIEKKSTKTPSTVFTPLKTESTFSEVEEISEWEPVKKEKSVDTISVKKEIETEEWEPISKKEIETSKKPSKKIKETQGKKLSKIKKSPKKEDMKSEETYFEPVEKAAPLAKNEEKIDVFKEIPSIDDKTAKLLFENGINSIELLSVTPIKKLIKIKGIRKKVAKEIKKDVVEFLKKPSEEKLVNFTPEITSTKSKPERERNEEWEIRETAGYKHGAYTLFRKEIIVGFDKKRVIHFFSKSIPDDGEAVELPDGYEVKINKATGVPYLKKK